ncbi:DUF4297 family anti-phage-associated protein [Psychrobacter pacificensis]|uniref:DUF4297 family anti-phage-associated protein n=2 Tax=Psychrobacter pacificensis TaxID=112002 RepID=UPI003D045BDB
MSDRSAIHTIKGYFYQFDYTIFQILSQENPSNILTVEEIEDLDIEEGGEITAIQCKYYENTEYNHSVISKPIRLMFDDFINRKRNNSRKIKYKLYGHYKSGQDKLIQTIDLDLLKSAFLTYRKGEVEHKHYEKLQATDNELEEFISILDIDVYATEYSSQLEIIFENMERIFNCERFEAENYYYNNALNEIKNLSIQSNVNDRKVSKSDFLRNINKKEIIFNKWFVEIKGKNQHLKNLKKNIFSALNVESFNRFFLLEVDINSYDRADLIELILLISKKYSKLTKRTPDRFCPFIFIKNIEEKEIIEIKKYLTSAGRKFIDGYYFQGADFSPRFMLQAISYENPIEIKFLNNIEDLKTILKFSDKMVCIYQFYIDEPFFYYENDNMKHIRIELKEIKDIKEVI